MTNVILPLREFLQRDLENRWQYSGQIIEEGSFSNRCINFSRSWPISRNSSIEEDYFPSSEGIRIHPCSPAVKLSISKKNRNVRLSLAVKHVLWTDEDWAKVYFSDESKFYLFGSDGKRFVRRSAGERLSKNCVKLTVKFDGGSGIVFGMLSAGGTGPLVRLQGMIMLPCIRHCCRRVSYLFLKVPHAKIPSSCRITPPATRRNWLSPFYRKKEWTFWTGKLQAWT